LSSQLLSVEASAGLVKEFTEEEVKGVVWDSDRSKSPGSDGFNIKHSWQTDGSKSRGSDGFNIKHSWQTVKSDIMSAIQNFHRYGLWSKGTNASFITIIPKVYNPQRLDKYRSISLVRSFYTIIYKMLANKLKPVFNHIIDTKQSAFLASRGILDSVLIANELLDEAKRENKASIVFKADFEKTYDSIDWDSLGYMMGRLCFNAKWIRWIKGCLESTTMSLLVNESPT